MFGLISLLMSVLFFRGQISVLFVRVCKMGHTVSHHAQRELWEKNGLSFINSMTLKANASPVIPTAPAGEIIVTGVCEKPHMFSCLCPLLTLTSEACFHVIPP